eukprot:5218686-Pyramimonas_sp.AAC.1
MGVARAPLGMPPRSSPPAHPRAMPGRVAVIGEVVVGHTMERDSLGMSYALRIRGRRLETSNM